MTKSHSSDNRNIVADLHVHTTLSDGRDSPEDVIRKISQMGLGAIAVTDHDTVVGIEDAMKAAEGTSLKVIPGIEMSTNGGRHLIGLFIDHTSDGMVEYSECMRRSRKEWAEKVIDILEQKDIATISFEDLMEKVGRGVVGKPHIAEMVNGSYDKDAIKEFIRTYLKSDGPAYVEKNKVTMKEAIDLILNSGGIPVLAHPWSDKGTKVNDDDIKRLFETGMGGIEIHYPDHEPENVNGHLKLAEELGLAISGGSDHHDGDDLGRYGVTEEELLVLEEMANALRKG